jgi:hypothetical protein
MPVNARRLPQIEGMGLLASFLRKLSSSTQIARLRPVGWQVEEAEQRGVSEAGRFSM